METLWIESCVVCWQSDSAEYQQADALWELFLELKTTVSEFSGPAAGNDDDDDEDSSRMSSVTDDTASRDEGRPVSDIQVTGIGPKVPVLKLKVGAGGYVEGSAVVDEDADTLNTTTQSNDCSSDFDAASENQSMTTVQSRLSSSSELDDQTGSEVELINSLCNLLLSASACRSAALIYLWSYRDGSPNGLGKIQLLPQHRGSELQTPGLFPKNPPGLFSETHWKSPSKKPTPNLIQFQFIVPVIIKKPKTQWNPKNPVGWAFLKMWVFLNPA